jgi:hypothetical protein
MTQILQTRRDGHRRTALILTLIALIIESLIFSGSMNISFYYLNTKLLWTLDTFGYFKSIGYIATTVCVCVTCVHM